MNLIVLATVIYVLVAIAMIVLILMQRGAGAQAGSGFGAGASATVFGASGSANFLSTATKWLAVLFFGMSLGMAWYASGHGGRLMPSEVVDVGLMSGAAAEEAPAATDAVPADAAEVVEPEAVIDAGADAPEAPTEPTPQEIPPQGNSGG